MSPEGAAALAQIDATLIVAIVVQATTVLGTQRLLGQASDAPSGQLQHPATGSFLYLAGLLGASFSLNIA